MTKRTCEIGSADGRKVFSYVELIEWVDGRKRVVRTKYLNAGSSYVDIIEDWIFRGKVDDTVK